jgi:chemotaxis protein CheY-P-specific phosphatase CheC
MHTPIIKRLTSDIAILFTANNINKLVAMKKDEKISKQDFLKQLGEIISNAYAYSMNQFLSIELACGKTLLLSNLPEVDLIIKRLKDTGDEAVLIKTNYEIIDKDINGSFILILAMPSISELLTKIKNNN